MFRDPFDPFGGWGRPLRDPRAQPRRAPEPLRPEPWPGARPPADPARSEQRFDPWGRPIPRAPAPAPTPAPVRRAWPESRFARNPHADERYRQERIAEQRYAEEQLQAERRRSEQPEPFGPAYRRSEQAEPSEPSRHPFVAPPRSPATEPARRAAPAEPPGARPHEQQSEHAHHESHATHDHAGAGDDQGAAPPSPPPARNDPSGKAANSAELALRRATEELEAQRRRMEREQQRTLEDTRAQVAAEMLPVLDNLDRSIAAAGPAADSDPSALLEGIRLVRAQFEEALARVGLTRIASEGQRFDPAVHDAIGLVDVDDEARDGVVVDEWQRGYRLGERVIRPAKVRVGKRAAAG